MARELRFVGPPGTGKTTELTRRALQAANRYGGEQVAICSLTKAAGAQVAQEIRKQGIPIPEQGIGTLHSFAFHALGSPAVASEKRLADWNVWIEERGHPYFGLTAAKPDADEAATENHWGGESLGDRCFEECQVGRARLETAEAWSDLTREFVKLWEEWKSDTGLCDFTDLLEWALRDTSAAPGSPSVLFMDEAQDTSMLGMRLLRRWAEQAEHLVIFGDPLQNLYHWAGTDPEAFTTPDVPDGQKRVLAQSYRVPRAVHAHALAWIEPLKREIEVQFGKPIEYYPRDAEGEVRRLGSAHWKYPEPALRDAERYLSDGKTVMFQAACSHMLEPLLAVLRREGIPFHNPWRVKRGDWNPLARRKGTSCTDRIFAFLKLCPDAWNDESGIWNAVDLWRWVEVIEAKGCLAHGAKARIEAAAKAAAESGEPIRMEVLDEWFEGEALQRAIEASAEGQLEWFEHSVLAAKSKAMQFPLAVASHRGLEALRKKPQIIVGTIHSLKGSEADAVYVMPDLSRAGMEEWLRPGPGKDGLLRAFYVAFTRARESLILCGQSTPDAVSFA